MKESANNMNWSCGYKKSVHRLFLKRTKKTTSALNVLTNSNDSRFSTGLSRTRFGLRIYRLRRRN